MSVDTEVVTEEIVESNPVIIIVKDGVVNNVIVQNCGPQVFAVIDTDGDSWNEEDAEVVVGIATTEHGMLELDEMNIDSWFNSDDDGDDDE